MFPGCARHRRSPSLRAAARKIAGCIRLPQHPALVESITIDRNSLAELQKDARVTFVELASRIGLSTSPCLDRVRRLEREGYIRGYTALLDPERLQSGLLVFVEISLQYTTPDIFEQFGRVARGWPQVLECHLVSGNFDYLLKIRISDMASYRELVGKIMQDLPGVRDSHSYVVMETVKESTRLPICD